VKKTGLFLPKIFFHRLSTLSHLRLEKSEKKIFLKQKQKKQLADKNKTK